MRIDRFGSVLCLILIRTNGVFSRLMRLIFLGSITEKQIRFRPAPTLRRQTLMGTAKRKLSNRCKVYKPAWSKKR